MASVCDILAPMRIHAEHYAAIRELLTPWSELWGYSILRRFGEMERRVPESWFDYGATVELPLQFALGQGGGEGRAPESLAGWVRETRDLCALPRVSESRTIQSPLDQGLTPKKKHEIEAILGLLETEGPKTGALILDIGGGAGHLARHLALVLGCAVDSVDRDPALQAKGQGILRTRLWQGVLRNPVRFVSGEFPGVGAARPAPEGAWAIGLHTCGRLAWSQLELASQGYSLLNVGCCYERMDLDADTQRSRYVRKRPLPLTGEALFLANRGGVERSLEEFLFQQRMQRYRFTLQELLVREGCAGAEFESVGSAARAAYSGSFAGYVRDRLQQLEGVEPSLLRLSDQACEDFRRSVEPLIERQRFVAFLRNLLARPLELAILLDRALLTEEAAVPEGCCRARLVELFDPRLSPRNVGLLVSS